MLPYVLINCVIRISQLFKLEKRWLKQDSGYVINISDLWIRITLQKHTIFMIKNICFLVFYKNHYIQIHLFAQVFSACSSPFFIFVAYQILFQPDIE